MDIQLSEKFIDEHLAAANGDFLKVYLYILRHVNERPDNEQIADALNMTEKDVQRAVSYWKKEGVLKTVPERTEVDIERLSGDVEFRALLVALQNYLGRRFTSNDAEVLGYMYDDLGMPADLIEYLFEICRQKGRTGLRYIEKVAQDWHMKNIHTVEDAKKNTDVFAVEINTIRRHMGLSGRELAKSELDYIDRWIRTWRMPVDIVCEACDRTVLSTGKPSFAYTESILKSWHDADITTLSQVMEKDRLYNEGVHAGVKGQDNVCAKDTAGENKDPNNAVPKPASKNSTSKNTASKKTNSFHNFEERNNDGSEGLDADVMDNFNDLFK